MLQGREERAGRVPTRVVDGRGNQSVGDRRECHRRAKALGKLGYQRWQAEYEHVGRPPSPSSSQRPQEVLAAERAAAVTGHNRGERWRDDGWCWWQLCRRRRQEQQGAVERTATAGGHSQQGQLDTTRRRRLGRLHHEEHSRVGRITISLV